MSEMLIRVVSKVNATDIYKDCQLSKRGDVIEACPDGWPWSVSELTSPAWRILKCPQLTLDGARAFLAPERPVDEFDLRKTLQRHMYKLDIDSALIPAALAAYLADDTRTSGSFSVALSRNEINALKVTKARIPDPAL